MENRVYMMALNSATSLDVLRTHQGICDDAVAYLVLTSVVMQLRMAAGYLSGNISDCDEQFNKLLETLVSDVRLRDQVLDAMVQRAREGSTNQ